MIPPRWALSGDKRQAESLRGFALSQLALLKNQMAFQGLFQGERTLVDNATGIRIVCAVRGTLDDISIYVPIGVAISERVEEAVKLVTCWCCRCFAEGIVRRVIGDYDSVGTYGDENPYPYAVTGADLDIQKYTGIRYQVEVCQGENTGKFVCVPTDFIQWAVGEKVTVLFRGTWRGSILTESGCVRCLEAARDAACRANWPEGREKRDSWNKADGTFVVTPLVVSDLNQEGFNWKEEP